MNKDKYRKLLQTGLDNDGLQFCLDALQEECAELIAEINRLKRGRVSEIQVIEEMADVQLMIDMVKLGLSDNVSFDYFIERKTKRIGMHISFKKGIKNGQKNIKKSP